MLFSSANLFDIIPQEAGCFNLSPFHTFAVFFFFFFHVLFVFLFFLFFLVLFLTKLLWVLLEPISNEIFLAYHLRICSNLGDVFLML